MNKLSRGILITCSIVVLSFSSASWALPRAAVSFGQSLLDQGALIFFKVNRNNIAGADFEVVVPGLCLYDDGEIAENTFSFGGGEFPDLLIRRNLKVEAEFEATSDTGHVGTLTIDCKFKKVDRKLKRARCEVNFSSPVRGAEQLDSCSGGATFTRILRGR